MPAWPYLKFKEATVVHLVHKSMPFLGNFRQQKFVLVKCSFFAEGTQKLEILHQKPYLGARSVQAHFVS